LAAASSAPDNACRAYYGILGHIFEFREKGKRQKGEKNGRGKRRERYKKGGKEINHFNLRTLAV